MPMTAYCLKDSTRVIETLYFIVIKDRIHCTRVHLTILPYQFHVYFSYTKIDSETKKHEII